MRDQNDRIAVVDQQTQGAKEFVRLLRRQHGSRLVENDDLCTIIEHLQDFHTLLCADRDPIDRLIELDTKTELLRKRSQLFLFCVPVAKTVFRFFVAEHDILSDSKRGDQHKLLMHHAEAAGDGILWAPEVDLLAEDLDLSASALFQPIQNFHQRGFSCAVLANQRMDLALCNGKIHAAVGNRPVGIDLMHIPHFNRNLFFFHGFLRLALCPQTEVWGHSQVAQYSSEVTVISPAISFCSISSIAVRMSSGTYCS